MERTFPYPVLGSWEMLVVTPKFDSCMYWIFNMHWNYYILYINTTMILNSNFWYRWGSHLPSLSDGDLCDFRALFFFWWELITASERSNRIQNTPNGWRFPGRAFLKHRKASFGQFSRAQNRSKKWPFSYQPFESIWGFRRRNPRQQKSHQNPRCKTACGTSCTSISFSNPLTHLNRRDVFSHFLVQQKKVGESPEPNSIFCTQDLFASQ